MKRITALFLLTAFAAVLSGCGCSRVEEPADSYTFKDYVSGMATNWNPHTYETATDSYPAEFIRMGLYSLIYNDGLHPNGDKAPFEAYSILPEMAAELPTDMTEAVKLARPEFGIPESAQSGYAYEIKLNPDAVWEDGTKINADTYVYSMRRLLDPELLNYRASDYYAGSFSIAGAEEYAKGLTNGDFSGVGLYKTGDYSIMLVLDKAIGEFSLVYNLTGNFIVHEETYERCIRKEGDALFSSYNTSADTTVSYGPYKLVSYIKDKSMRFERNESWYGYSDGRHVYKDPVTEKTVPMYMTTAIETQVVAQSATAKMMFKKGELSRYTLQAEDYDELKNSEYALKSPGETTFFLILNGHAEAVSKREQSSSFDTSKQDIQTLTLESFRKGVALTYDKELLASAISPARYGAFGLIGDSYIYDPQSLLYYRDTEAAKKVLCDFYSVDTEKYGSLDEAVASISGYDPETAREYYRQAFADGIRAGFITDSNGDGICDQNVVIEYCMSTDSDFMTRTVDYLTTKMNEVTEGTPFEGRISFTKSAPYGNDWVNKIKAGLSDTVLAGWSGSVLDPFGLCELYTDPSRQYDAAWFDSETVSLTLTVNTAMPYETPIYEDVTMSLRSWSEALGGKSVSSADREFNFGEGMADTETRLSILAAIEGAVLSTYNYIPMLADGSVELTSKQVYRPYEKYNPVLGFGGIAYLAYNYSDSEWAEYVSAQNGILKY